jgi:hypothetical protein
MHPLSDLEGIIVSRCRILTDKHVLLLPRSPITSFDIDSNFSDDSRLITPCYAHVVVLFFLSLSA